jgi:hypothetical protein
MAINKKRSTKISKYQISYTAKLGLMQYRIAKTGCKHAEYLF